MSELDTAPPRKRSRRRRRNKKPESARPEEVLEESRIEREKPATEELSPDEAAEMRLHLRFIRDHRRTLKLKLNATEDLLVNGVRQPTHRGICLHLLSKVDRSLVLKGLERLDDAASRTRLLAGVVRFSDDPGLLILYLESFTESSSRAEAAGAFSLAVSKLDWSELSASRMRRILELVATVFIDRHERASVVFGLLHSPSFRETFSEAAQELPPALGEVFRPLVAVYEGVIEGDPEGHDPKDLVRGSTILLDAPEAVLRSYPPEIRMRLMDLALRRSGHDEVADRAAGTLLSTLPPDSDLFLHHALERSAELLRRHSDDRARWQLRQLRGARQDCQLAVDWLKALSAPRLGRMALIWPGERQPERRDMPGKGSGRGLQEAFWLDEQRRVWLRVGSKGSSDKFVREAKIHQRLGVAGVAPFLVWGKGEGERPWLAIPALGRPADRVLQKRRLPTPVAIHLADQGVRILGTLAAAGYRLPDARSWRFLITEGKWPHLLLADLTGIIAGEENVGPESHRGPAFGWCRDLLWDRNDLPPILVRALRRRRGKVTELLRALALSI